MKHRSAERADWKRVTQRRFFYTKVETPDFRGVVTLLCIDAVSEPLCRMTMGELRVLADAGYTWLQLFPEGAYYTVAAMFDTSGQLFQWYIDICLRQGVDERGIPWLDDLYLDIVLLPNGQMELKDADELDEALGCGEITPEEYDLAWQTARELMGRIERGELKELELSESQWEIFPPGGGLQPAGGGGRFDDQRADVRADAVGGSPRDAGAVFHHDDDHLRGDYPAGPGGIRAGCGPSGRADAVADRRGGMPGAGGGRVLYPGGDED
jgi:predicted RNA-binding protein associated with RNAse of E/G family